MDVQKKIILLIMLLFLLFYFLSNIYTVSYTEKRYSPINKNNIAVVVTETIFNLFNIGERNRDTVEEKDNKIISEHEIKSYEQNEAFEKEESQGAIVEVEVIKLFLIVVLILSIFVLVIVIL